MTWRTIYSRWKVRTSQYLVHTLKLSQWKWTVKPAQGPSLFGRHSIWPQLSIKGDFSFDNTFYRTKDHLRPQNPHITTTSGLNSSKVSILRARVSNFCAPSILGRWLAHMANVLVLLPRCRSSRFINVSGFLIQDLSNMKELLWIFLGWKEVYVQVNSLIPEMEGAWVSSVTINKGRCP